MLKNNDKIYDIKPKVLVLGNFGYTHNNLCGQTVKTRNIYELLKSKEVENFSKVEFFDTATLKGNMFSFIKMFSILIKADVLFYLPATKNLTYIFSFIFILSKLFSVKIHFVVVGGWLGEYLKNRPIYRYMFSKTDQIYPETDALCHGLKMDYGFKQVKRLNNFRDTNFFPILKSIDNNVKLVFMARVHPLKGVETLFKLSQKLNQLNIENVKFDIYGPVYVVYQEKSNKLLKTTSKNIAYRGVVQPNEIHKVLSKYDAMLFPTQYYTEGFPGSILDAYFSGIPVIASNWKYATEFIDHTSGAVTAFNDEDTFLNKIMELINKPDLIETLKQGALTKSYEFSSDKGWDVIKSCLFPINN
ncbi:MAG: glycosyltransferase family 4 protein [Maribacter arcticus]|uniref:glycosyltransferase family 4 protein n=1 Tax=Maribacter arcticus TaxID=561365 RepID=UPI0030015CBA